jgi:hypothetical protein
MPPRTRRAPSTTSNGSTALPSYRLTENDNPSNRSVGECDGVAVREGHWVLLREGAPLVGAALGSLATSDYTLELEDHGGTWVKVDPDHVRASSRA